MKEDLGLTINDFETVPYEECGDCWFWRDSECDVCKSKLGFDVEAEFGPCELGGHYYKLKDKQKEDGNN